MNEKPLVFGPERNLYGVLSLPDDANRRSDLPAVLLPSVSLHPHHVGAFRTWVTLARRLADLGFVCLRYDIGGTGESEAGTRSGTEIDCVVAENGAAMELVEKRTGIRRFVLIGLCASADTAHSVAFRDARIMGIVLIDAYGYRTLGQVWRHYVPRLLRAYHWSKFLQRKLGPAEVFFKRDVPSRREAQSQLQRMVDRGVQMLFLYTGGASYYFNHHRQFRELFPDLKCGGRIEIEFDPLASHLFEFPADRERMFANVIGWINARDWH